MWDQTCAPGDQSCEFTGEYGWGLCKPQYGFEADDCGDDGYVVTEDVPAAYLGPLVTVSEDDDVIVCHAATS